LDLVALIQQGPTHDDTYVETTVRQVLQRHDDLFAFQKQVGFGDGTLRAIVEFSDTNAALRVFSKYRVGLTVDVGSPRRL